MVVDTLKRRYKNVLNGYARNLVTRPKPTRLYEQAKKQGERCWSPVFLMDDRGRPSGPNKPAELMRTGSGLLLGGLGSAARDEEISPMQLLARHHWNKAKARSYVSTGPISESTGIVYRIMSHSGSQ